jgi:hypothetical protein
MTSGSFSRPTEHLSRKLSEFATLSGGRRRWLRLNRRRRPRRAGLVWHALDAMGGEESPDIPGEQAPGRLVAAQHRIQMMIGPPQYSHVAFGGLLPGDAWGLRSECGLVPSNRPACLPGGVATTS